MVLAQRELHCDEFNPYFSKTTRHWMQAKLKRTTCWLHRAKLNSFVQLRKLCLNLIYPREFGCPCLKMLSTRWTWNIESQLSSDSGLLIFSLLASSKKKRENRFLPFLKCLTFFFHRCLKERKKQKHHHEATLNVCRAQDGKTQKKN